MSYRYSLTIKPPETVEFKYHQNENAIVIRSVKNTNVKMLTYHEITQKIKETFLRVQKRAELTRLIARGEAFETIRHQLETNTPLSKDERHSLLERMSMMGNDVSNHWKKLLKDYHQLE